MLRKIIGPVVALFAITAIIAPFSFGQAPQTPTLKLITPQDNQTIYGRKLPILVAVENFTLTDPASVKTNVAGQGHIHLWLDEQNPTKESAVKLSTDEFTYSDVPYGTHTLKAELVANDHSSLKPPVVTQTTFTTAEVVAPSPVATAGFDKNTALVIFVVVALVILAAWWYTKEDEEEETKVTKETKPKRKTKRKR